MAMVALSASNTMSRQLYVTTHTPVLDVKLSPSRWQPSLNTLKGGHVPTHLPPDDKTAAPHINEFVFSTSTLPNDKLAKSTSGN